MFALLKKEVRSFLSSLIGYIVMSVFLLLMGLFLWVFPFGYNIPTAGYSRLDAFFELAPMIFLFLIPAITMRSFSEEKRTGTFEILLTRPVSDLQIIISKYLGGFILVVFSLLPTLIYFYTIQALGDPPGNADVGGIWGSYVGLFFIGAAFVAIGIFCSSISQNQVVAFILSVFVCFIIYMGFSFMGSYSLFGGWDTMVRKIGIMEHYQSVKRGVIDTRDVIYFISVVFIFLLATKLVLESRKKSNLAQFIISLLIIICINFIGGFKFFRLDLTEEKIHSLAPSTIKFLEDDLKGNAMVTVYLTGDIPADLKYIERTIKEKLDEMKAYAGDKINYEFVDLQEIELKERAEIMDDLDQRKKMLFSKLIDENGGETYLFTGATIKIGDLPGVTVNFFYAPVIEHTDPLEGLAVFATEKIEYHLINGFRKAQNVKKPNIAILEGHGEAEQKRIDYITTGLKEFYNVERVSIKEQIHALDLYQGLLIIQPDSAFTEKDKFVIDQFIMRGGRVAWFLDPIIVPEDSLIRSGQTYGLRRKLNLDDQLFTYGVKLDYVIAADLKSAPIKIPGYDKPWVPWPFYPLALPSQEHVITRNINPVKTEYTSTLQFAGPEGIKRTPLLTTSQQSTFFNPPVRINYNIVKNPVVTTENRAPGLVIGALLEGQFKSVFDGRLTEKFVNSPDYVFLKQSPDSRMLVFADGDIPINEINSYMHPVTNKPVEEPVPLEIDIYQATGPDGSRLFDYGNRNLLLNAIDYLMGNEGLIELRQRTIVLRKLDVKKYEAEKGFWQFANVGFPIILILIFGLIQHYIRKKKYSS